MKTKNMTPTESLVDAVQFVIDQYKTLDDEGNVDCFIADLAEHIENLNMAVDNILKKDKNLKNYKFVKED